MRPQSEKTCAAASCKRLAKARGYCDAHYRRLLAGNPIDEYPIRGSVTKCPIDSCGRPIKAYGLCETHYWRKRNAKKLDTPLVERKRKRSRDEVVARDGQGRKHCPYCDRWLDIAGFSPSKDSADGLKWQCSLCHRAYRHGTDFDSLMKLMAEQGGLCKICARPLEKNWAVDHDHSCCPKEGRHCGECTRGLLCVQCNVALGLLREDLKVLQRMARYIESWNERKKENA